ncbi:N-acetylglutamate synthase-like GNAT family acetyltransferase [Amycolatopsis sulphurea]|uniref:N-acetylglutamate synthase-like GNAT family acetyltransferase n=1 Tax=Amycolatopsis sulphurea TaxID=76022 RepID=A0A2A9G178_9PSEU|nr:GNAT family N-acetyltransferase [Amycolatopsis sulphurea]PFG57394.1 N-acetylglutamate synthase-like GNAT family acetyltransferase [Amycolatopsis sulphurea]
MPDAARLLAAYDHELRAAELTRPEPGLQLSMDGPLTRITGGRRGFIAGPPDLGLHGDALATLIARQCAFFTGRGEEFEWKTRGHDRPADLPARLLAAGFTAEPTETVFVAPLDAVTPSAPPAGDALVREAHGTDDLLRIASLTAHVFGHDEAAVAADLLARARADDGTTTHVVAEADGRFVSAARLELVPGTGFAGLWGGATLPGWRGRGLYRALVTHRVAVARAHGARYLLVDALPPSRPILERLGFLAITTTTPYTYSPVRSARQLSR